MSCKRFIECRLHFLQTPKIIVYIVDPSIICICIMSDKSDPNVQMVSLDRHYEKKLDEPLFILPGYETLKEFSNDEIINGLGQDAFSDEVSIIHLSTMIPQEKQFRVFCIVCTCDYWEGVSFQAMI